MPEENQNMDMGQYQQESPISSLREETNRFNEWKALVKQKTSREIGLRKAQETEKLYTNSLTSSDPQLCSQYDRACKASEMARGIRKYGESQGYDWSNVEDIPLLNQYSELFPDSGKIMKDYITRTDEDDPMPYYIKLGFEQPNEEDEARNWLERTLSNYWWSFDKTGQGLRTIWNDSNMYDKSGERGAIQDYAYDVYGRKHPFSKITEEEWKNVERDLRLDPSLLDKYKNRNSGIKDLVLGGTISALNSTPIGAAVNMGVSGAAATKPGEELLGTVGGGVETVGYYANKLPLLRQYRDSLATEEDKKEWDMFVGGEILALLTRGSIKTYKQLKGAVDSGGGGWIKRFQENKRQTRTENLKDTAGKIAKTKTVEESEIATRGLQDADISGVKNYKELQERLSSRGKEIEALEDIEYAKDPRKFKPEETRSMKTFEKDGYKSSVMVKPIEDGINLLKDFYEGSPEKLAQLDLIEQKFLNEGLTKAEMNNISRAIAQEYETYTARGQQKTSIAAKDVEGIRRAVKDFARAGNDTLVELDKQRSDNMNTSAMVKDIQNEIIKTKNNLADRNIFQKSAGMLGELIDFFGGKALLTKILPKLAGNETINAITRQKQLSKYLKEFRKLNEKLNGVTSKAEATKIVKEFNEQLEKGGPIEGEIIQESAKGNGYENTFLEDRVEVSPK